jgi:hypothetical protein
MVWKVIELKKKYFLKADPLKMVTTRPRRQAANPVPEREQMCVSLLLCSA